jgi:predicted HicB family RNase H-like nuclease
MRSNRMARRADEPWTQLATRIPKELHRRLKLHCVTNDIMVQDFVVEAIEEKLGRKARPKKGLP